MKPIAPQQIWYASRYYFPTSNKKTSKGVVAASSLVLPKQKNEHEVGNVVKPRGFFRVWSTRVSKKDGRAIKPHRFPLLSSSCLTTDPLKMILFPLLFFCDFGWVMMMTSFVEETINELGKRKVEWKVGWSWVKNGVKSRVKVVWGQVKSHMDCRVKSGEKYSGISGEKLGKSLCEMSSEMGWKNWSKVGWNRVKSWSKTRVKSRTKSPVKSQVECRVKIRVKY